MHTLKPIVKAVGATLINQYPAVKAHKQSLTRLKLINKIYSYHAGKMTLTRPLKQLLKFHKQIAELTYLHLDINNTIDHTDTIVTEWNQYMVENPAKLVEQTLEFPPKPKAFADEATKQLLLVQNKSRASYMKQRIHNAMEHAHKLGWYVVFDTLTLAPDKVEQFYNDTYAIRDYTRKIGRLVNESLGLSKRNPYTENYQYICVPEYGTKNGRLHFHLVHLMKALPKGQTDPNFGRPKQYRTERELRTLKFWKYSDTRQHKPLCVRYKGDAYGAKLNWLMPLDKDTKLPIELKPLIAVGHYIAKYINKSSEQDGIKKDIIGASKWNRTLRKTLNNLPTHTWKIRTSRGFGMQAPSMTALPSEVLIQLTQLHWSVTPISKILKHNAKKELKTRLRSLTLADLPKLLPNVPNLLALLRASIRATHEYSKLNSTSIQTESLTITAISNHTLAWLETFELLRDVKIQSKASLGSK